MDNYVINLVEQKINRFNLLSRLSYKEKCQKFYNEHPCLSELEQEKKAIISDFKTNKAEKEKKIAQIEKTIKDYLKQHSLEMPKIEFFCSMCNDTGYIESNGKKERCSCFKKLLTEETLKDISSFNTVTFEDFDDSVFDEDIKSEIIKIKNRCFDYSSKYPTVKKHNLALIGNTGTGKTFLLSCVCSMLKSRGFNVVFITAGKLFDILRKYAFNQINDIDVLLNAEFLIIDDLGTEPLFNNITVEYLFLVINERSRNNMPICFSTNLNANQIKHRYTERISSRLLDKSSSHILLIPGNDLRLR